jgi:iron complex outermembrane receptor protein
VKHFLFLASAAAILTSATAAQAQQATTLSAAAEAGGGARGDQPTPGDAQKAHPDQDQSIVVTGVRRQAGDVLGGVSVMDKEELTREARTSIGETLQGQPGVTASSFGPTASRPILRGLQGERVRILVDGIGSLDLSSSDPDHAVAINPLTAQRIEVLRGPSALLFGSSAIGGVVNVIDTRIPRSIPTEPVHVDALVQYGSAANERSANLSVDAPLGGHFVAHVDGAYSKFDDLEVGGFLLSKPLREEALASPDPGIRALASLKGKLPNTDGRIADVAGGLAYVDGDLNIGVSVSRHTFNYGVPIRFSLDPGVEAEQPTIDGRQTRADLRVDVPIGGVFKVFEFRGGIAKYHHDEIGDTGEIGSSFSTHGGEMRADLVQTERGGWGGTSGVQYLDQHIRLSSAEKYLPDGDNRQMGLFTLQSLVRGKVRFEAGARIEFAKLNADADTEIAGNGGIVGTMPFTRSFTPVSGSLGATYEFVPGWRAGLSLSHSERAPSIDELYSQGPHGGSQSFLFGSPDLEKETSNSAELSVHHVVGPLHLQGSVYYSRFNNFIYLAPTGDVRDDLPVYEYRQGKAEYLGFELGSDAKFGKALGIDWGGEVVADAVRATIRNFGPAPQIPPFRALGALTGSRGQVDGRLEVERVSGQDRTAPNETSTPGFTLVNASFDWHPFSANPELTLSLQGNNLFDVEARRHSSFLKDYAPLSGRDIRLSARMSF